MAVAFPDYSKQFVHFYYAHIHTGGRRRQCSEVEVMRWNGELVKPPSCWRQASLGAGRANPVSHQGRVSRLGHPVVPAGTSDGVPGASCTLSVAQVPGLGFCGTVEQ